MRLQRRYYRLIYMKKPLSKERSLAVVFNWFFLAVSSKYYKAKQKLCSQAAAGTLTDIHYVLIRESLAFLDIGAKNQIQNSCFNTIFITAIICL